MEAFDSFDEFDTVQLPLFDKSKYPAKKEPLIPVAKETKKTGTRGRKKKVQQ